MSSVNCKIYIPGIGTPLLWSYLFWEQFSIFAFCCSYSQSLQLSFLSCFARYPLLLDRQKQYATYGIICLSYTPAHDQQGESNPRHFGLESIASSTRPHVHLLQCFSLILSPVTKYNYFQYIYFWITYDFYKQEVLRYPNSTWLGFELVTSRSWQYISCHWDACFNHLAIIEFNPSQLNSPSVFAVAKIAARIAAKASADTIVDVIAMSLLRRFFFSSSFWPSGLRGEESSPIKLEPMNMFSTSRGERADPEELPESGLGWKININ